MCINGDKITNTKIDDHGTNIPWLARAWKAVGDTLPNLKFPGTNLGMKFTLLSFTILSLGNIVVRNILESSLYGWPVFERGTYLAASTSMSFLHSTILCGGLAVALWSRKYSPSEPLHVAPPWWQEFVDSILQFCTGYMVYDSVFLLRNRTILNGGSLPPLTAMDKLFLAHHFVTSFYMTSARVYKAGHGSAMMCMFLGELSNPLMGASVFSGLALKTECCGGHHVLHTYIELCFSIVYLFLRTFFGPLVCAHMSWDLLFSKHAKDYLPLPLRCFWVVLIWAVIFGSYGIIVECYKFMINFYQGGDEEQHEL